MPRKKKVNSPKCRACGKELKKKTESVYTKIGDPEPTRTDGGSVIVQITRRGKSSEETVYSVWTGKWGAYGDGHFCGLTCGWRWAIKHIS